MARIRIIDKMKRIAKEHRVTLRIHKRPKFYGGFYLGDKKTIVVVDVIKEAWFISAFLHELSHVFEHREGIYASYYKKNQPKVIVRRLALRAERHTDKRANILCKKYFPKVRYKYGYRTKVAVTWLKEFYGIE